ncbi:PAS domain-containing protein, partial [Mycobacterium sp.]|uniref:PAS domain-containing protein n=1 Tax=Mycobacterium sp. TaxID=1785 RepID=UPI003C7734EE
DRRITYASANTPEWIGREPDQLFDSPVMSIFPPDEQQRLEQAIEQTGYRPSSPDLYAMRLAAAFDAPVDLILHQGGGQIVIEMEGARGRSSQSRPGSICLTGDRRGDERARN